jgi:hypothetical protein
MSPTIDLGLQSQPELWLRVPRFVVVVPTYVFEILAVLKLLRKRERQKQDAPIAQLVSTFIDKIIHSGIVEVRYPSVGGSAGRRLLTA